MGKASIEWTDESWNPTSGCAKVSGGCRNCYASRIAKRFWGDRKFSEVRHHPERLEQPLHWRKPRRVFVDSMSDLFHRAINRDFVDRIFGVMAKARRHTFQVLTKRPDRMEKYIREFLGDGQGFVTRWGFDAYTAPLSFAELGWPLPNVWLGISCEDQKTADERIPLLLRTPAAVRFGSLEPLLGPIKFKLDWLDADYDPIDDKRFVPIRWVIVGGETGPGARPCHPDWVRSIRDQCQAAGIPFFFKGWGEWIPSDQDSDYGIGPGIVRACLAGNGDPCCPGLWRRVGKKAAGRLLDGREWNEFPDQSRTKSATRVSAGLLCLPCEN